MGKFLFEYYIEDLFNFINLIVSEDLKNDTVTLSNLKNIRFKEIVEFIKSEYNLYFIKITIYMWILKVLSNYFQRKFQVKILRR